MFLTNIALFATLGKVKFPLWCYIVFTL